MEWLIGRRSKLSLHNKLLLYKQIIRPVWTYGIQLWDCSSDSNLEIIQIFQNKILRSVTNAEWYVRNADLHRDLQISTVKEEIAKSAQKHRHRLLSHNNATVSYLYDSILYRRLKRTKPVDLIK